MVLARIPTLPDDSCLLRSARQPTARPVQARSHALDTQTQAAPHDSAHLTHSQPSWGTRLKVWAQQTLAAGILATSLMGAPCAVAAQGLRSDPEDDLQAAKTELVTLPGAQESPTRTEHDWVKAPVELASRLSHAQLDRQVGDYRLHVDVLDARLRVKPKVKLSEVSLKAQSRVDLLQSEFKREQTEGDWQTTQGLRGRVRHEAALGLETKTASGDTATVAEQGLSVQLSAFKTWQTSLSDTTRVNLSVEAGASRNFASGDSTVFAEARQKLTGEQLELWGSDFAWSAEARERAAVRLDSGDFEAEYEVFCGLEKTFPVKVMGHRLEATVKVGPKLSGDLDTPCHFSPATKLSVDF